MDRNEKDPGELAEELASHAEDDPRFRNRRPGVRATRHISREEADADTAGMIGGTGTTGGGQPAGGFGRTEGQPVPDNIDPALARGGDEDDDVPRD
ncbi:hypothetical protein [Actinomadura hibisca]|uniref:hypothetical protein n=1 Tax=Actinomadura hibisca TaxID=68565 RepID=UPI00082EB15E|nr:hypothetical protein [Actinomadura hibisca]